VYDFILRLISKEDIKKKAMFYSVKSIEYYLVKHKFLKRTENNTEEVKKAMRKKIYDKLEAKKDFKKSLQYNNLK
jgi:hypothetical protein